jgi:hypothetical protein
VTLSLLPLALLAAGAAPDAPAFVLHSTRDDRPAGVLVRLDDAAVQVAGAAPVPAADLVALRRHDAPPPPFPHDRPHLLFVNGDRLPGRLVAITGDKAHFRAELGREQELTAPLSALTAAWLTPQAAARAAGPDGRRLLAEPRRQDVVWLGNNDSLQGTVTRLDGDALALDAGGQPAAVPRDRLRALLFNTELARTLRPRGPYRQLVLRNGARLSLKASRLDGADLTGTTLFGADVRVPLAEVAGLNVYQGKAVYLSDLPPRRYEHTPYWQDLRWPLAADRAATGQDLRLAGGTYDKGLGMHSHGRATFAVPPGGRRFEALVGLDEVAGRAGAARVQVLADDKPLLGAGVDLTAGPPRELRLPLPPRARTLTLVVEYGPGGDVQDCVNWAAARVVPDG